MLVVSAVVTALLCVFDVSNLYNLAGQSEQFLRVVLICQLFVIHPNLAHVPLVLPLRESNIFQALLRF